MPVREKSVALEDCVLDRLTADLSEARRRFAFALEEHKYKFWSQRESILHAPENGDYFEKHKKQWIQDVRASLANRLDQLINLQQQTRRSEASVAVDRASQLIAPVVNDECNLFNVLRNIEILGEYLPRGIPELYGRDSLTAGLLSKLLVRVARSQFKDICADALIRHATQGNLSTPTFQANNGSQKLPPKQVDLSNYTDEALSQIGLQPPALVSAEVVSVKKADHQEPPGGSPNRFVQLGDVWSISFDGKTIHLRALVGLRYLQELIRCAGRSISADGLISLIAQGATMSSSEMRELGLRTETDVDLSEARDLGPQRETDVELELNKETIVATEKSIKETVTALMRAERASNESEALRLGGDLEALEAQLKTLKFRNKPGPNDRNRVSVTQAIDRAIEEIEKRCPELGAHLRDNRNLRRGQACCYLDRETAWDFS